MARVKVSAAGICLGVAIGVLVAIFPITVVLLLTVICVAVDRALAQILKQYVANVKEHDPVFRSFDLSALDVDREVLHPDMYHDLCWHVTHDDFVNIANGEPVKAMAGCHVEPRWNGDGYTLKVSLPSDETIPPMQPRHSSHGFACGNSISFTYPESGPLRVTVFKQGASGLTYFYHIGPLTVLFERGW